MILIHKNGKFRYNYVNLIKLENSVIEDICNTQSMATSTSCEMQLPVASNVYVWTIDWC